MPTPSYRRPRLAAAIAVLSAALLALWSCADPGAPERMRQRAETAEAALAAARSVVCALSPGARQALRTALADKAAEFESYRLCREDAAEERKGEPR